MPHSADLAIARRALSGERAAFDELYERLYGPLLAHPAKRLGPGPRALAVTEASFAELFERLPSYGGKIPLAALALTIVQRRTLAATTVARALATVEPSPPGHRAGAGA